MKANVPDNALQEPVLAYSTRVKDTRSKDWVFVAVHISVNESPIKRNLKIIGCSGKKKVEKSLEIRTTFKRDMKMIMLIPHIFYARLGTSHFLRTTRLIFPQSLCVSLASLFSKKLRLGKK